MRSTVKIFGERHTGTRFLRKLLELNFDVELLPDEHREYFSIMKNGPRKSPGQAEWLKQALLDDMQKDLPDNLGWKHSCPGFVPLTVTVITTSKRPARWLKSMYRKPYERMLKPPAGETFGEFIRYPWVTSRRENTKRSVYETPLDLYHEKLLSYDPYPLHIRYEELVANIKDTLAGLPMARKATPLRVPARSTKNVSETTQEVIMRYQRDEFDGICDEDREFIEERWRLLNRVHGATLQS